MYISFIFFGNLKKEYMFITVAKFVLSSINIVYWQIGTSQNKRLKPLALVSEPVFPVK